MGRSQRPVLQIRVLLRFTMLAAFLIIPVFLLSLLLMAAMLNFAHRAQLVAIPTARSSHTVITPVGGGVAIVFAYLLGIALLALQGGLGFFELLALSMSLPVAVAGFIDDRSDLHHRLRLLIQASSVVLALLFLGPLPELTFGGVALDGLLLGVVLAPLCLLWLTNLYNFMDGIDGLAGTQTGFVSLVAAALLASNADYPLALLCLFIFAGSVAFTVWNWPQARIFMGDVGSGFAGMSLGLVALLAHIHATMSLWSWFILLAVFVVDASTTLLRRVLAGQPWAHAHRQHAYQHMANCPNGHKIVSIAVLLINVIYLLPLAFYAGKHPEYGVYFTLLAVVPLTVLAILCGAGKETEGRLTIWVHAKLR